MVRGEHTTPAGSCTLGNGMTLHTTLTLEGMSTGTVRLSLSPETILSKTGCGAVLTSTIAVTYLPKLALDQLLASIKAQTKKSTVIPKDDFWLLCYEGTRGDLGVEPSPFNAVTLHFKGGLDVVLKPIDLYVPINDDTVCLLLSEADDITEIGTYALQDKNVAYVLRLDLNFPVEQVTIAPATC